MIYIKCLACAQVRVRRAAHMFVARHLFSPQFTFIPCFLGFKSNFSVVHFTVSSLYCYIYVLHFCFLYSSYFAFFVLFIVSLQFFRSLLKTPVKRLHSLLQTHTNLYKFSFHFIEVFFLRSTNVITKYSLIKFFWIESS